MELNYKVFGTGQPVVIMHGLFGMLDNWQSIAKKLAEDYMVFILDLRNHGKSPHSNDFSYQIMAEDVREFLESKWVYEADIIGHSMGGKVAMQLALEHSDMINKLMVVDMAPKTYKGNHETIFEALFALDLKSIGSRKEADQFLLPRIPEFSTRQFLLKNIYLDKVTREYKWKMNLSVLFDAYQDILGHNLPQDTYLGDTLFVKGENSDYINFDELEAYQEYFPNGNIVEVAGAGHWVHAEQPQAFLELAQEFLKG